MEAAGVAARGTPVASYAPMLPISLTILVATWAVAFVRLARTWRVEDSLGIEIVPALTDDRLAA